MPYLFIFLIFSKIFLLLTFKLFLKYSAFKLLELLSSSLFIFDFKTLLTPAMFIPLSLIRNLINLSPAYLTVHLNGGKRMIEGLIEYKKKTKLIGVSMLTSLDQNDLKKSGILCDEMSYVEKLVKIGASSGIDGVVSSPKEVKLLRKKFKKLIIITPGIRLPDDDKNDQKRIETPGKAIKNGSSLLIIGRTITKSINPISSIEKIIQNIENAI